MSTTMLSLAGVAGPGGVAETAESTVSCLYSVLRSVVFVITIGIVSELTRRCMLLINPYRGLGPTTDLLLKRQMRLWICSFGLAIDSFYIAHTLCVYR